LGLDNGKLLIAVNYSSPTVFSRIVVYHRLEDDDTYTSTTVANVSASFGVSVGDSYPSMCLLPDNRILLVYNEKIGTPSGNEYINFKSYISDDEGVTWTLHSEQLITDTIPWGISSNEYLPVGVQIAALNGQVLLLLETTYTSSTTGVYKNRVFQFGSIDEGQTFTRVTSDYDFDGGFHRVRLQTRQNKYFICYIGGLSEIHSMQIPHAFFSVYLGRFANIYTIVENTINVEANVNNFDMAGGEVALCVDKDDVVYIYYRRCNQTSQESYINKISLNGTDWEYSGLTYVSSTWYQVQDTSTTKPRPTNIQATSITGRIAIAHNIETSLSNDESLLVLFMGGYSTLTLPYYDDSKNRYKKLTFKTIYIPYIQPQNITGFTVTGAGSSSIDNGRLKLDTSSLNGKLISESYTTTLDEGLVCRCRFEVITGGSITDDERIVLLQIGTGTGTSNYGAFARISNTQIALVSYNSGNTIGSPQNIGTGQNELILAIANRSAQLWICTDTKKHVKEYTFVAGLTTLQGSSVPITGGLLTFGHPNKNPTVQTYFYEVMVSSAFQTGLQMADYTPELSAMNYPPAGKYIYIADGVQITTLNGPAKLNDEYRISPRYDYAIDNVFYVNSPSLQTEWRSQSVSAGSYVPNQDIVFQSLKDSLGRAIGGNGLYGIHLNGINFKLIQVYSRIAGTSTPYYIIANKQNLIEFYYDVKFGAIIPNTANSSTGQYIRYNEFAGASIQLDDHSNTIQAKIISNTEGTLSSSSTKKPIFYIEKGVTIPNTGSASDRIAQIIPTSCTILLYLDGSSQEFDIKLRFVTSRTVENYFKCSHISIGPVVLPGQQYSRGRTISRDSGTISEQLLNGTRFSRNVRPSKRTLRLSWSDPIDLFSMSADQVDPDYWTALSSSTDAVATAKDVPMLMLGLLQRLQGSYRPLVYLPYIERLTSTGSIQSDILLREDEQMLAVITSDITIESVIGDENQSEAFRVSTITIEEVI
jgi:hypothetical protein